LLRLTFISDQIKASVKHLIQNLKRNNSKAITLSVDSGNNIESATIFLGIEECTPEVLPDQKGKFTQKLRVQVRGVGMDGDGINVTPALALAARILYSSFEDFFKCIDCRRGNRDKLFICNF
jgi:P-type E1-E2 ATPase